MCTVNDKCNNNFVDDQFNITWLNNRSEAFSPVLRRYIAAIGAEAYGVAWMAEKGDFYALRAENLRAPAVAILKQEFLSKGGECAVNSQNILGQPEKSSVIMLATARQYQLVCRGIRRQQFGLPRLADEIEAAIAGIRRDSWELTLPRGRSLALSNDTQVMGILNVTPDSFSDGGEFVDADAAVSHARQMLADGAVILDVGGESTRPGHTQISEDEEIRRVCGVIARLRGETDAAISVDTYKPGVARAALAAGADIINDIWGLQYPGDAGHEMARLAAEQNVPVIAMFNREKPADGACSGDILSDTAAFLRRTAAIAAAAGLSPEQLVFDIGFGFGKTPAQNMQILAQTGGLRVLGRPLLVATSRKSTLGLITGRDVHEREFATAATTAQAAQVGAALVRVHDVRDNVDVIKICRAWN